MIKPVVVTDDSVVNCYGFRVMSDGGDLSMYYNNPILLYDHARRESGEKNAILPIGKMNDINRSGSQWVATPEFDLDDPFAAEIARKYEKGFLNMASIGFEPIEWTEDPAYMLPGQTMPTILKWFLKEISITDVGGNRNCHKLYHAGSVLTLNANTKPDDIKNFFNSNKQTEPSMKKVIMALNATKLLTLSDASNEELVAGAVETLAQRLSDQTNTVSLKDKEIERLTAELTVAKTAGLKDKANTLVESALSAKKIVDAQKEKFVKLASASEEGFTMVKEMFESMAGYQSVNMQLNTGGGGGSAAKSEADLIKEFDELSKTDGLNKLRDSAKPEDQARLNELWTAKYGKPFKA